MTSESKRLHLDNTNGSTSIRDDTITIHSKAYARIGLIGNPSDGYFGRTISCTIKNYHADIWLECPLSSSSSADAEATEGEYNKITLPRGVNIIFNNNKHKEESNNSNTDTGNSMADRSSGSSYGKAEKLIGIQFVPHPKFDQRIFSSFDELHKVISRDGYDGGMRLLMATCKKFTEFAKEKGLKLRNDPFRVSYDTTIPRQIGLAGSSAIVTALTRALMAFNGIEEKDFPVEIQANFILSVERDELGIAAGLQDRVIQCMEGLVDMDFDRKKMEIDGFGEYTRLPLSLLPKGRLYLAMNMKPKESGKVHSDVRRRWNEGDEVVIKAMELFASFAKESREALCGGMSKEIIEELFKSGKEADDKAIGKFMELMNANFNLRRSVFGDNVVGADNIKMVEIGRSLGAACKLPGSGGAVLGLAKSVDSIPELESAYKNAGYSFVVAEPV